MPDALLCPGDLNLTGSFSLHDLLNCQITSVSPSLGNRQSVIGGVAFPVVDFGATQQRQAAGPYGSVALTLGLILWGGGGSAGTNSRAVLNDNRSRLAAMLTQARQAASGQPMLQRVSLAWREDGSADFALYDVVGGTLQVTPTGHAAVYCYAQLTLYVLPAPRRAPDLSRPASGTLTAWAVASQYRIGAVAGELDAALTLQVKDLSASGFINRLRIARRSAIGGLQATDSTLVFAGVNGSGQPCSAGADAASVADATAANGSGHSAQLFAGASWKTILSVPGPASGTAQNLRAVPLVRLQDASAVIGRETLSAPVVTNSGGYLKNGVYTLFTVPKNGSNFGSPSGAVSATVNNLTQGLNASVGVTTSKVIDFENGTMAGLQWAQGVALASSGVGGFGTYSLQFTSGGNCLAVLGLPANASKISTCRFQMYVTGLYTSGGASTSPIFGITGSDGVGIGIGMNNVSLFLATIASSGAYSVTSANPSLGIGTVHTIECTWDGSGGDIVISISIDGVGIGAVKGASGTSPGVVWWGCMSGVSGPLLLAPNGNVCGFGGYLDNIFLGDGVLGLNSVATGAQITQGIATAGSGATGRDLFINADFDSEAAWWKVSNWGGGAITTYPPSGAVLQALPQITPVSPVLVRVGAALYGSSDYRWSRPFPAVVANGKWEALKGFSIDLPPSSRQEGASVSDRWQLAVQVLGTNGGVPLVKCDGVTLLPYDEDVVTAYIPGANNGTAYIWELDTDRFGRVTGCRLRDTGSGAIVGQAEAHGKLWLGPGDNSLVVVADTTDGAGNFTSDAVHTQFSITPTRITPREFAGVR